MTQVQIPILDLKPQFQSIKAEIQAAIDEVLESGQFIMGPVVRQFEEAAAAYLGAKHAIGVNSGTDALVIGLKAMGIGEGDEVITTPFSFFATAESISNVGAKPVFVDVQYSSFNLDPNLIEAAITPCTKAIMPVHLYGNPCAMAQIMDIAATHGLKVIEDCAQAFGAVYQGDCSDCASRCQESTRDRLLSKRVGTIGNVGAFSFFPTKNLGAYGDGGLVVTDDDKIANLARMLRSHGSIKKYHNEILGYNSRLDALQAAILQVKLTYIDTWNQQRRQVAENYNKLLAELSGIVTPSVADGHVFHQYTVRILNSKRDEVRHSLAESGVSTMVYYPVPQDRLPIYAGQHKSNPVSDILAQEVLSLPIWPKLEQDTLQYIVQALRDYYKFESNSQDNS